MEDQINKNNDYVFQVSFAPQPLYRIMGGFEFLREKNLQSCAFANPLVKVSPLLLSIAIPAWDKKNHLLKVATN